MDEEYRAVFGDYEEAPPVEGETEQVFTEPSAQGAESPALEQPPEPVEVPAEVPAEGPAESTAPEQSPEERHRQATLRRQREETQRLAAEQTRRDQIYADLFLGQTDPFTKRPITTEAEFRAFRASQLRQQQEAALAEAGLKPEVMEQLVDQRVSQHPDVRAAREAIALVTAQQGRAAEAEAQRAIAGELQKISALDPGIKTLEDIGKLPSGPQFNRYVQQGLSLVDAFYLANRTELDQRRLAAAKQTAINQTRGKQTLSSGAGEGKAGTVVPAEEIANYRAFMPDATEEEIAKAYAKYKKDLQ